MISPGTIDQYKRSRGWTDKSRICHAPFVNLNFEQNGNITACCYNRKEVLGRYPEQSILDAWYGESADKLRKLISQNRLEGGCAACGELLEAGNYKGVKALTYDEFAPPGWFSLFKKSVEKNVSLPKVLELEISNVCNLECTMCNGYFSSTIRKNREGLPPMPMVYDQAFVEQVKELMPGLTDIKFLGGEPFLIDLYYDIWEAIPEINPGIRVHITTNGTVLNQRAKNILKKLNAGIVVSIDTVDPDNYALIRKGGNFHKVMDNITFFKELTRKNKTYLSIAACAMNNNWRDFPGLLEFCNREGYKLHFNTVWTPQELSLQGLSRDELKHVMQYLEAHLPESSRFWEIHKRRNIAVYKDLISTLRYWWGEKFRVKEQPQQPVSLVSDEIINAVANSLLLKGVGNELLIGLLRNEAKAGNRESLLLLDKLINHFPEEIPYPDALRDIWGIMGFNEQFVALLNDLAAAITTPAKQLSFIEKTSGILERFNNEEHGEHLGNLFLKTPILEQVIHIQRLKKEDLFKILEQSFS